MLEVLLLVAGGAVRVGITEKQNFLTHDEKVLIKSC